MDNIAQKYSHAQSETSRISIAIDWLAHGIGQYAGILFGLVAGTAAKYRLDRGEGRRVTWTDVLWDMLLLPALALICVYASKVTGAGADLQAVIAVLLAVSSDRVIRVLRRNFIRRVDDETRRQADEIIGGVRQAVQVERSGASIIEDTLSGRGPETFEALKHRPKPRGKSE